MQCAVRFLLLFKRKRPPDQACLFLSLQGRPGAKINGIGDAAKKRNLYADKILKQKKEKLQESRAETLGFPLKDLGILCNTKHNVHRLKLNLHRLKIMIVESLHVNLLIIMSRKYVLHVKLILVFRDQNYFCELFHSFLKMYSTSASNIYREAF